MARKLRLAVLLSGGGTNLQALLDRADAGTLAAEIVVVASDRPEAYGLVRARKARVPTHVVDYRRYLSGETSRPSEHVPTPDLDALDRAQRILTHPDSERRRQRLERLVHAEQQLIGILEGYRPDYVCLAGFMRLLTPFFLRRYNQGVGVYDRRVLNIHPALLPSFPGQHGYRDTFYYGCKWGGVTVHFVDEGEDTGPIIAQLTYPIWPEDDLEQVSQRGLQLEYEIYAQCINWLAAGQVQWESGSHGRLRTRITDPHYRHILKSWMEKALA